MKSTQLFSFFLVLLYCQFPQISFSQSKEEGIQEIMAQKMIPGITYAYLERGKLKEDIAMGTRDGNSNPVNTETVFSFASLSKPVFAYLVFRLIEEGILTLDQPLFTYYDYEDISHDPRHQLVTARMILSHTSGLPNWRKNKLEFKLDPGQDFSYSGEGYVWLQHVVTHLTHKNLEELAQEYVFQPLGMKRSSYVFLEEFEDNFSLSYRKNGNEMKKDKVKFGNAAASLQSTAHDFGLFLEALLAGRHLSRESRDLMFSPAVKVDPQKDQSGLVYWGLGVGIQETPSGRQIFQWGDNFTFRGYFTANLETKNAVVYFTNSESGLSPVRELVKLSLDDPQPATDWMGYD